MDAGGRGHLLFLRRMYEIFNKIDLFLQLKGILNLCVKAVKEILLNQRTRLIIKQNHNKIPQIHIYFSII